MRILLAAALLLTTTLPTQAQKPQSKERLRFTLILSRHGIRPPLSDPAVINTYAAQPWPTWEVPLGHLTPHGAEDLKLMGAYMRTQFDTEGIFTPNTCPKKEDIYLYADTDERNISSTRATLQGLAPNCGPFDVNTWIPDADPKKRDPVFLPLIGTFTAPPSEAPAAISDPALLAELAHILAPDPAHPAAHPILPVPPRGATTLVENLELEYIDNKPMSDVGWGRVDEATLRHLLPLHINAFAKNHRTGATAKMESSNLLAHILDTLQQAAGTPVESSPNAKPTRINGAFGYPGTRLVYISAHDTNLHGIAGLLNLHWTIEGVADEVPPDAQLVFELWQKPHSKPGVYPFSVRVRYRAQTLGQLRNATATPPLEVNLKSIGCKKADRCDLPVFLHAARATIDPAFVQLDVSPTQVAP